MTVTNDNSDEARVPSAASDSPAPGGSGGFVLPFDPLRLLSAALRKWYWILLSALVVGGLAAAGGRYKFEPVFTATAQLMRQESGGTFRASELGEPFKPRQVSVATLVSLMKSPAVLQHVSEQTEPKLSPRAILGGLTLTPERNTDLITVAYKSSRSEPAALRTLNLFGAEVVRLVREMQAQEAADVNRLLKQQIVKAEADLRAINQELLTFSQEAGVVSVDKEIDAYLRKQGELDLKYEVARIDYETLDLKIRALEKELAEHNPLRERVQLAQEQLADLRTHYTHANPLVEEQKERVAALEKQPK